MNAMQDRHGISREALRLQCESNFQAYHLSTEEGPYSSSKLASNVVRAF